MSEKTDRKDHFEPDIVVNGVRLDERQAMAVRVALQSFAMRLESEGMGDDEHGRFMAKAYVDRVREINQVIGDCRTAFRPRTRSAESLDRLFPFSYLGGGYFRRKGVPEGKSAEVLHGMEAVRFVAEAMAGGTPEHKEDGA